MKMYIIYIHTAVSLLLGGDYCSPQGSPGWKLALPPRRPEENAALVNATLALRRSLTLNRYRVFFQNVLLNKLVCIQKWHLFSLAQMFFLKCLGMQLTPKPVPNI